MLSQHERRQLEQIEQWFEANDPQFSTLMSGTTPARSTRRGIVTAALIYALGVGLIVLGVIISLALIFPGALAISLAACIHVATHRRTRHKT
jgi:hypothetical protein